MLNVIYRITKRYIKGYITSLTLILTGTYLFKVNNGNTRPMCEICSDLTMKIWWLYCYL